MGRKVFISILGIGPYSECVYTDGLVKCATRYIQLATLKSILNRSASSNDLWTSQDSVIILLTDKAKTNQWEIGKTKTQEGAIVEKEGLLDILRKERFPMKIIPQPIVDGRDESEIWDIFNTIYSVINEGDELYFDITHALRYLPMLLLVLINYVKFLKNVSVKSITYGNFMVETTEKPIMDLTSLSSLQDWTFAAGQYIDSGNVSKLVALGREELKPILKHFKGTNESALAINKFICGLNDVIKERQTCRGLSIIKSDSLRDLKSSMIKIEESLINPLTPIIEKIKESLVSFDEFENAKNGYAAAKWCYENGLYQQSATILQEYVVTFFCLRHNIMIDNEDEREIINQALNLKFNHQEVENGDNWSKVKNENKSKLKEVLSDELLENHELVNLFNNLREVRNDFNHSGMRSRRMPLKPDNIKQNIKKCIEGFGLLLS
ncbi:MAG: TIGR02221 family CRISPR-associated protein [Paludibacteraceae bacterium]|nr:TIGR02221 family CRISPR-associated protein [Paludibacteraceae bacterium]